ncbi:DNA primase [Marinilabiliaceae bacterium ANBcel2]|nr:DNA primase [Marinilabiliaceae bacterium ANBcel2]
MIDNITVDKVMEAAQMQITDVISDFINLKKRGVNYIGHCPFHNEKTPSFIVSPNKGIFKCFGCGKGGNAVNFIMEHEQISFVEAIKTLGKKFHIEVDEKEASPEDMARKNERESMLVLTEFAGKFFIKNLFESDEGHSVGLSYLRSRGFRDDIIKRFQIGYSPEEKDAFIKAAQINGYKFDYLEKTGLAVSSENYRADRFRGRVIFPIHSLSGKVIGFGGRILKSNVKAAKYLNSPESEIYHKSKILYGIYQAKQDIVRSDKVFLVEGYTDVLSFYQNGIKNVVASSGTALTIDQISLMVRFTKNITLVFDGDEAGISASMRGTNLLLGEGVNVKILLLPDGEDPDSFAKKYSEDQLADYISQNEKDFIKFKTSLLVEESKNDPVKRAGLIRDIVKSISVIPDPIVRSVYVKECSSIMDVEEPVLYSEISKLNKQQRDVERKRKRYGDNSSGRYENGARSGVKSLPQISSNANPFENEEREILKYLLRYGDYPLGEVDLGDEKREMTVGEFMVYELQQDEVKSENAAHKVILEEYENNYKRLDFSAQKYFVSHCDPTVSKIASDLVAEEYQLSKIHHKLGEAKSEEEVLSKLIPRVVNELKWKIIKVNINNIQGKLQEAEQRGDIERVVELMGELGRLQTVLKYISLRQGERTII